MRKRAATTGVEFDKDAYPHSYKLFVAGMNYADVCFTGHPVDLKAFLGVFTWLGLLIDDFTLHTREDTERFHERFLAREPQPTPLLEAWSKCLQEMYIHFHPVCANLIVTNSLNFVAANILETTEEFKRLKSTPGGRNYPYYLRDRTGISEAFVYFTFPKAMYPDFSQYLEALPDMCFYVSICNDIFSFYKEELNGDTDNYIRNRTHYENKDVMSVLKDIIGDLVDSHDRIFTVLKGREQYMKAWHNHAMGSIAFHKLTKRYRLWEVGLGEDPSNITAGEEYVDSINDLEIVYREIK
ncbi:hypothetical protein ABW20_dc0107968 [Dactylellina cionopaga]|nr:hypothetical protein ABW20_dc0107968 [Dactylellina cionopaga]